MKYVWVFLVFLMGVSLLGSSQTKTLSGTLGEFLDAKDMFDKGQFREAADMFSRLYQDHYQIFPICFLKKLESYVSAEILEEIKFIDSSKYEYFEITDGSNEEKLLKGLLRKPSSEIRSKAIQKILGNIKEDMLATYWIHFIAYMGEFYSVAQKIENYKEDLAVMLQTARQGDMFSQCFMGNFLYEKGDFDRYLYWMDRVLQNPSSSPEIMKNTLFDLGYFYINAEGKQSDFTKAAHYFKTLLEYDPLDLEAMYELAKSLETSDPEEASKLIKKLITHYTSSQLTDAIRHYLLSFIYEGRFGLKKDGNKIFELMKKKPKNPWNHYWRGICYHEGLGVPKNYLKAKDYFEEDIKIHSGENHESYNRIAVMYSKGGGNLPQDYQQALFYFERAVAAGSYYACISLSFLYFSSLGGEKKLDGIADLCKKSGDICSRISSALFLMMNTYIYKKDLHKALEVSEQGLCLRFEDFKNVNLILKVIVNQQISQKEIDDCFVLLESLAHTDMSTLIYQTIEKMISHIQDIRDKEVKKKRAARMIEIIEKTSMKEEDFMYDLNVLSLSLISEKDDDESVLNPPFDSPKSVAFALSVKEPSSATKQLDRCFAKMKKEQSSLQNSHGLKPGDLDEIDAFIHSQGTVKKKELTRILEILGAQRSKSGYMLISKGMTAGLHLAHGRDHNVVDPAAVKDVKKYIEKRGYIK